MESHQIELWSALWENFEPQGQATLPFWKSGYASEALFLSHRLQTVLHM